MRRLLAIAVPAAALLLAVPATAGAKGILGATICGAEGCRAIPKADHQLLGGGRPAATPARPEPFVRMSIRVGVPDHVERVQLLFLPRSGLVLGQQGTTWMHAIRLRELRAIARRVTPLAASDLPGYAPIGSASASAAGALPPEVYRVTPADAAAAAAGDDGLGAWWLALPAAAIALAAGVVLARRRRRGPPATAAGATG